VTMSLFGQAFFALKWHKNQMVPHQKGAGAVTPPQPFCILSI
jgi:hypothetical protein